MKTIHYLVMPEEHKVLSVEAHRDTMISIWAEVNTDSPTTVKVPFKLAWTGQPIPKYPKQGNWTDERFLGTVKTMSGIFFNHIYVLEGYSDITD